MYRIFNVAIDSELVLPELSEVDRPVGMPVYSFVLASEGDLTASLAAVDWFHDWVDPRGNVTIRAGRSEGCHWLRFPRLVDFSVDLAARRITAYPAQGTDETTLRHLLLDQVIPRVLGQEGALVLHAGAVQLQNGKALAFVGQTGSGKSTLASSFEQNGARLITDDCLLVVHNEDATCVVPNYAGVRLFDDSLNAIYGARQVVADVAQYTSKRRLVMARYAMGSQADAISLDAMFLLGDPAESECSRVHLEQAAGTDSLMMLVAQSFLLDIMDKALVAKLFGASGKLLRGTPHCFTLNYPRDHNRLGEVRAAVTAKAT